MFLQFVGKQILNYLVSDKRVISSYNKFLISFIFSDKSPLKANKNYATKYIFKFFINFIILSE